MKLFLYSIFIFHLLSFATNSNACLALQNQEALNPINSPFDTVLLKAQMLQQPVVLIANAANCYPCAEMMKGLEKKKKLQRFLGNNFICHEINLQADEEAKILRNRYKLYHTPALLFLDAHGNVIAKLVGTRKPSEIKRFAKKIRKKYPKG